MTESIACFAACGVIPRRDSTSAVCAITATEQINMPAAVMRVISRAASVPEQFLRYHILVHSPAGPQSLDITLASAASTGVRPPHGDPGVRPPLYWTARVRSVRPAHGPAAATAMLYEPGALYT